MDLYSIELIAIDTIKPHEETIPERVLRIEKEIQSSGELLTPLWVDNKHFVLLNGHHRLEALRKLGCNTAPCLLLDYDSPLVQVKVCSGATIFTIDKISILKNARAKTLYPPRSSFHTLKFSPPLFSTSLSQLRGAQFGEFLDKLKSN